MSNQLTDEEKLIDEFLAGWGGLRENRKMARYYLEHAGWNVSLAQDRYWRENILIY